MKNTAPVSLNGVPETMLYTLYNRAQEARRSTRVINDPEAIRIYNSINFDFRRFFGSILSGAIASRAATIDGLLLNWLQQHPSGHVISLGEGLETQRHRVDNGALRWITVDLPEVMAVREQFLPATNRFINLAQSVFDFTWLDRVNADDNVFIVAQGLFMYFPENQVKEIITTIFQRLPKARLVFDFVSINFIQKAQNGFKLTNSYTLPPMYWGSGHHKIKQTLQDWLQEDIITTTKHYDIFSHGIKHLILDKLLRKVSSIGNQLPGIAYVYANQ